MNDNELETEMWSIDREVNEINSILDNMEILIDTDETGLNIRLVENSTTLFRESEYNELASGSISFSELEDAMNTWRAKQDFS